jgi:hypothetical protein
MLLGQGLLREREPGCFQYAPRTADLHSAVTHLDQMYRERRVAVITLIASKPIENVRSAAARLTVGLTAGAAALLVHPRAGRLPKPDDTAEGAGVRLDHGALPSALVHHQVPRRIRADVSLALGHARSMATARVLKPSGSPTPLERRSWGEVGYCMR